MMQLGRMIRGRLRSRGDDRKLQEALEFYAQAPLYELKFGYDPDDPTCPPQIGAEILMDAGYLARAALGLKEADAH
jgi:hypothetical protein